MCATVANEGGGCFYGALSLVPCYDVPYVI